MLCVRGTYCYCVPQGMKGEVWGLMISINPALFGQQASPSLLGERAP